MYLVLLEILLEILLGKAGALRNLLEIRIRNFVGGGRGRAAPGACLHVYMYAWGKFLIYIHFSEVKWSGSVNQPKNSLTSRKCRKIRYLAKVQSVLSIAVPCQIDISINYFCLVYQALSKKDWK